MEVEIALVTQPMLQPTPNQTELRLMVSKSIFNVDSKNVCEKFLHCRSSELKITLYNPQRKIFHILWGSGVTFFESS